MRNSLLTERKSMAFETVLSMPDKLAFMREAKAAGYFIRFFYIGTNSVGVNLGIPPWTEIRGDQLLGGKCVVGPKTSS